VGSEVFDESTGARSTPRTVAEPTPRTSRPATSARNPSKPAPRAAAGGSKSLAERHDGATAMRYRLLRAFGHLVVPVAQ
jgi:hypothetical protein